MYVQRQEVVLHILPARLVILIPCKFYLIKEQRRIKDINIRDCAVYPYLKVEIEHDSIKQVKQIQCPLLNIRLNNIIFLFKFFQNIIELTKEKFEIVFVVC